MALASDLIAKVRIPINDTDASGFRDQKLLVYLNSANRFVRRVVANNKPMMLAEPALTKTVAAGEQETDLGEMIIKLIDIRINGKKVAGVELNSVEDLSLKGRPENYVFSRMRFLRWVPIPDADYALSAVFVKEATDLLLDSVIPWPAEYHDLLIEYCVIRAQLGNEFGMSEETQIMSLIHDQIIQLLTGVQPSVSLVRSYFDPIPSVHVTRGYR